jgi:predicted secreted protein
MDDPGEQLAQIRATAVGLDAKSHKKIIQAVHEQHIEQLKASIKRNEEKQKREQSAEWKANRVQVEAEVAKAIRNRPDVAADLFLGSGEIAGQKTEKARYTLDTTKLTDEQKASLPRHYVSASGLDPDALAPLFGFHSGNELVAALGEYNKAKGNRSAQELVRDVVKNETERQMQKRYGDLKANILDQAYDDALTDASVVMLGEEYQAAALQAGITPIDKAAIKEIAMEGLLNRQMDKATYKNYLNEIGKFEREVERAFIAKDPITAVKAMMSKYIKSLQAQELKKLEQQKKSTERLIKRYATREVQGRDPTYTDQIHGIMQQLGLKTGRSGRDVAEQIAATTKQNLEQFVFDKGANFRIMDIWDQLYEPGWKKDYKDLTVGEFREVAKSLKLLDHNSREEMQIELDNEKIDRANLVQSMVLNLSRGDKIRYDADDKRIEKIYIPGIEAIRGFKAAHLTIENIFGRFDHFDPKGPFSKLLYELIDADGQKEVWKKEFAKKLIDIKDSGDMNKVYRNDIWRSDDDPVPFTMRRRNLLAIMLNAGTKSNIEKMAGGYKLTPEQMMNYIHEHATKEDWIFVQRIWDDIFKEIKGHSDRMYRSLTGGVAAETIPAQEIDTPFGKFAGGYYPIIHRRVDGKGGGAEVMMDPQYFSALPGNGYTKKRTGDIRQMSITLDDLPGRLNSMIHDIAMRPAVINASKIFADSRIERAIKRNFGSEYHDLLKPYLQDVANAGNKMTAADAAADSIYGMVRQNLISSLVGANISTIMKHIPSAFVTSVREVGGQNYLNALKAFTSVDEATGLSNWDFMMKHSVEMQRRERNSKDNLFGATNQLGYGADTWSQQS